MEDGTCKYAGCMKDQAFNYDPVATFPGKCIAKRYGCTDSAAANYYNQANTDDGLCKFVGCIDSTRLNYDEAAVREPAA